MTKNIKILLDDIIASFDEMNFPLSRYLREGLEKDAIKDFFRKHDIIESADVLELYQWKNGVRQDDSLVLGQMYLIPGYYFMDIEESFSHYEIMCNVPDWDHAWFPIFASGGGDFYAVDLSVNRVTSNSIIGWMKELGADVEYQNLDKFLFTIKSAIEKNIFFLNEEGYLDMRYDEYDKIARNINKNVAYWNDMP